MAIHDFINRLGGQRAALEQIQPLFGGNGVQGIMSKLTSAGLGEQVQSWIGTGENKPVSGDQLKQAMDPAAVRHLAEQTGLQSNQIADHVAQVLPQLVDQATPQGKLPTGESGLGTMVSKGKDAAKRMFNR